MFLDAFFCKFLNIFPLPIPPPYPRRGGGGGGVVWGWGEVGVYLDSFLEFLERV